jgi:hypothetical protein
MMRGDTRTTAPTCIVPFRCGELSMPNSLPDTIPDDPELWPDFLSPAPSAAG